ncbi:MAG: TonB-dependent receptor [Synergistaceae bacterium]|nr:TonB-dependent receptor [Synergistaceae bacterium]
MRSRTWFSRVLVPFLACLPILFALPAFPEETPVTAAPEIVTGSRLAETLDEVPAPTDVITSADIASSGAKSLGEILDRVPGIISRVRAGSTQEDNVLVRGLVTEVLYLLDGVPYYKSSHVAGAAAVDLRSIPAESIERIEIVRGAASALYGSMAAGGVIHIITKKPEKTGVSVNLEGGSQDWRRYGFRASAVGEAASVTAWATHREEGRSRLLLYDGVRNDNLSYREDAGGLKFVSGAWSLGGEWGNAASEWEYGTEKYLNRQEDDWKRLFLSYDDGTTRFALYRHVGDKFLSQDSAWGGFETSYEDTAWGSELSRRFSWADWAVSLGAAYRDESMEVWDNYGTALDGSRNYLAPFVEFSRALGEVLLDIGLRYENWNVEDGDDQSELTPKMSLSWQAPGGNLWYLSAGRFFAMPSLYEIAYFDPWTPTTPSPSLKPEKGWTVDLGVKGSDDRGPWSVGLFALSMDDKIEFNNFTPDEPSYVNLSEFRSVGLEASRSWRLSEEWRWDLGLTWMKAEVKETPVSPWQREGSPTWSVDSTWTWGHGPWEAAFALHYLGDRENGRDGFGPECQGDATTADLRLAYTAGDGRRAILTVTNLFDEDVLVQDYTSRGTRTRYFAPERRVTFSWQWAF